jgi:hypothetical protein
LIDKKIITQKYEIYRIFILQLKFDFS